MRVFCAAEVVLDGEERAEVMKALREFADKAAEAGVHGLWVEKVEGLLSKEVLGMLVRVKKGLPAL